MANMLLCPVRAVKYYLSRTGQVSPQCNHLFVSQKKCVTRNTVSFWIYAIISEAYNISSGDNCRAVKVKARKAKGTGASMLFRKNFAVQQIFRAGT